MSGVSRGRGVVGKSEGYQIPEDVIEVGVIEFRKNMRDLLERVAFEEDELVITRAGKAIAAVISMDAFAALRKWLAWSEESFDEELIGRARTEEGEIPLSEVAKDMAGGS